MLNLNDVGRPLAKIVGGKYDNKVISVTDKFGPSDDETFIKEFKQLKIPNDAKLQQVPDTTKEREIVYMTGPSGSGKSTYTRKYRTRTSPFTCSAPCPKSSRWTMLSPRG